MNHHTQAVVHMKTQACTFFSIVQNSKASVNRTWQPCANSLIIDHQTLICPIIASTFVIWHIMYVCLTDLQITDARSNLFPGAVEYHGCLAPVLWQPSILEAGAAMPILRTPSDKFPSANSKTLTLQASQPIVSSTSRVWMAVPLWRQDWSDNT